jgi:hypothetical protein
MSHDYVSETEAAVSKGRVTDREARMDIKLKKPAVMGRVAQVDICPSESGFVLSVGPVSLWLDSSAAEDVLETLARALSMDTGGDRADRMMGDPPLIPARPRRSN